MIIKIKVIKTEEEYKKALKFIENLMDKDPDPDSEDGEKLNLLATLIHDYESKIFPESLPDPIDAIEFRMEQQNLKPKDLVPYVGSRSKVSEILSRKRSLTLDMIRAIEKGLGIPAKVLLKEIDEFRNVDEVVWNHFPLKEMEKRGYLDSKLSKTSSIRKVMKNFFRPVESPANFFGMLRKTNYRSTRPMDKHALVVWSTAVVKKAKKIKYSTVFKPRSIDLLFMQKLAQLSVKDKGPILAQNLLRKYGIALVIEPHFPQTYLDGATILINKKHPIIGLTLRYDRLDNFWFTLMHELAHIVLHYDIGITLFYDEIEGIKAFDIDDKERKADALAEESLLPKAKWEVSPARLIPSSMAANSLAKELGIHVAIIAGQIRHKGNKYVYLNKIVNEAKVRKFFLDERWNK